MLLLAFLQAPGYTRWLFLTIVPVNLAMDLQNGYAMEIPALVTLLVASSLGFRLFVYIKTILCSSCSSSSSNSSKQQEAIKYSSPMIIADDDLHTPPNDKHKKKLFNDSYHFNLADQSLMNDSTTDSRSRSSTPLPTLDDMNATHDASLLLQYPAVNMRSILQDRLDDSISSSVHRRSTRIASSMSFREGSPTPSLTPSSGRPATPRRPSTPRRNCAGKCVDGTSCRNAATKESAFCWQHSK